MKKFVLILIAVMGLVPTYGNAASTSTTAPVNEQTAEEKTHWITISSGVRHNKNCRYYKNSKGRMCGKSEGRACKKCGG